MTRPYANLGLFTDGEEKQLEDIAALVTGYLARDKPPRPLCLAVFGAPGSGKSRLVKALPTLLKGVDRLAKLAEINLTQVTSVDALARALAHAAEMADGKVPFVFFDEFDSAYQGAPWGWLSWFLAPMQDGAFRNAGALVHLKKAVYVFAGGTVSAFDQFGARDPHGFALAKGPDFVSRLRGYLDLLGVNADEERILRRQASLDYELTLHTNKKLTRKLRTALLHVGRYKHGARSIGAVVELLPTKAQAIRIEDIREHPLLKMHVDRGPLDSKTIGGCIGVSSSDRTARKTAGAWREVCESLFRDGATLACGGRQAGRGLMRQLENVMRSRPRTLESTGQRSLLTTAMSPSVSRRDPRVEVLGPELGPVRVSVAKRNAIQRQRFASTWRAFRMRYRLALRCVAQFAIGGSLEMAEVDDEWKRFPGVVEEIMLAIALGHPVYVAGAQKGAAAWAGVLLGLGRSWAALPAGFDNEWLEIPPTEAILFRPSPLIDLPLTRNDLIRFLREHALGGSGWVDNGLTPEENRLLFAAKDAKAISKLVVKGLRTRFDRVERGSR